MTNWNGREDRVMASIYRRKKDGPFYITYSVRPGVRKTVCGCKDHKATEAFARKLETDAMLRREGIIDSRAEKLANFEALPLQDHLDAFESALRGKGGTESHVVRSKKFASGMLNACGFESVPDIDPAKVAAHVTSLKRKGELGARSINARITALKSFTRWLWRTERARTDPLATLTKLDQETDRRYRRRPLTDEELGWLVRTTEKCPTRQCMTGPNRTVLYLTAVGTGFRAGELKSLTPASFDLDADPPTVTVEASYSKRRHRDVQPIRIDLAGRLRPFLAGKTPDSPVFHITDNAAETLRKDLADAREAWLNDAQTPQEREERQASDFLKDEDTDGRVVDFHSFRHTYVTRVVRSGASVKVAQDLARHSTPMLTLGVYTHLSVHDHTAALAALPAIDPAGPTRDAARATGTDHVAPLSVPTPEARSANAARRVPEARTPASNGHDEETDEDDAEGAQALEKTTTCERLPIPVMVGEPGIEPGWAFSPGDFKSPASANSATRPTPYASSTYAASPYRPKCHLGRSSAARAPVFRHLGPWRSGPSPAGKPGPRHPCSGARPRSRSTIRQGLAQGSGPRPPSAGSPNRPGAAPAGRPLPGSPSGFDCRRPLGLGQTHFPPSRAPASQICGASTPHRSSGFARSRPASTA